MSKRVCHHLKHISAALTAAAFLASCTGGQSGISVSGSAAGDGSLGIGSIALSSFKQVLGNGYAVVGYSSQTQTLTAQFDGTVRTTSSSNLQVRGKCARGVSRIIVRARKTAGAGSGATVHDLTTDLTCVGENFTWVPSAGIETPFAVAAEGTWELTFVPVDGLMNEQAALGGKLTVEVDTSAPAAPSAPSINGETCPGAVWTSCATNFTSSIATPTIAMTVPTTTHFVRVTGCTAALDNTDFTDGEASFVATLGPGDAVTCKFQSYDELGNTAGDLDVPVSYTALIAGTSKDGAITSMSAPNLSISSSGAAGYVLDRPNGDALATSPVTSTGDASLEAFFGKSPYLMGLGL